MSNTRKITYSAVGAAVSAVCVFLTNFGFLKVSLLMCAALCYYIVCIKCGIWYGLADVAVSLLITFFTGGVTVLSSAFLLDVLVFAPYAIVAYLLRKLYYTKWQTALIRVGAMAAFANIALCAVWFCAKWVTTIDIMAITDRLGGYPLLALVFTAFTLIFDLLFNQLAIRLCKLLK